MLQAVLLFLMVALVLGAVKLIQSRRFVAVAALAIFALAGVAALVFLWLGLLNGLQGGNGNDAATYWSIAQVAIVVAVLALLMTLVFAFVEQPDRETLPMPASPPCEQAPASATVDTYHRG